MKSNAIDAPLKPDYPCLKRNRLTGTVIMFTGSQTGTIVHLDCKKDINKIGDWAGNWEEKNFDTFNGVVELSND